MKVLVLVLSFIFSLNVFSKEVILTHITNDYDRENAYLILILDKNNDIQELVQTGYLNGKQIFKYTYKVDNLYTKTSIYQRKGKNIVDLVSANLTNYNGGHFNVTYLYNGLTGSRRSFEMELIREDASWSIVYEGKKIKDMKFIINKKPIVGPIGVKKVTFNYL